MKTAPWPAVVEGALQGGALHAQDARLKADGTTGSDQPFTKTPLRPSRLGPVRSAASVHGLERGGTARVLPYRNATKSEGAV